MRTGGLLLGFIMTVAAVCSAACSSPDTVTTPSILRTISLGGAVRNTPDGYVLGFSAPGQTAQITVTGSFSDGAIRDLTKQSSFTAQQPAIATVNADGVVTATGEKGVGGVRVSVLGVTANMTVVTTW